MQPRPAKQYCYYSLLPKLLAQYTAITVEVIRCLFVRMKKSTRSHTGKDKCLEPLNWEKGTSPPRVLPRYAGNAVRGPLLVPYNHTCEFIGPSHEGLRQIAGCSRYFLFHGCRVFTMSEIIVAFDKGFGSVRGFGNVWDAT